MSAFFPPDLLTPAAVTALFAVLARLLRAVNTAGALAGAAVTFLIYATAGLGGFMVLLTVFIVTWACTRLGAARKQQLQLTRDARGRNAAQVLANAGVGAAFSVASVVRHEGDLLLVSAVAALAEAAADTASSECGEALARGARLITTLKRVPVGTNGAISVVGTLAGVLAAAGVAATAAALSLVSARLAIVAAVAATAGMTIDSLLGATLEPRRLLGNNAVNFLSTLAAALIALALA